MEHNEALRAENALDIVSKYPLLKWYEEILELVKLQGVQSIFFYNYLKCFQNYSVITDMT